MHLQKREKIFKENFDDDIDWAVDEPQPVEQKVTNGRSDVIQGGI